MSLLRRTAPLLPRMGPAAGPFVVGWQPATVVLRPATGLWWLHPVICVALVGAVYAAFMAFDFERVVPKAYIPGWHYAWGGALLVTMALGMALMTALRDPIAPWTTSSFNVPRYATAALLAATVLAYAVWFAPLAANPSLVTDILAGERSNVRDVMTTMPGVTTMTQFGVAYVIVMAALRANRARPIERWEWLGLVAVVGLAALRALVWSERLAVIELVVVYVVARLAFTQIRSARVWNLANVLPLVAPLLLYLVFTGTEYFRSWDYFRTEYPSIWAFSFERLLAYYATASNNGIGLLVENQQWPEYTGRFVAEWLYMMPDLGDTLRTSVGDVQLQYQQFLDRFARPEFNNPSGLFQIVFDIGYLGSMVYFMCVGGVIGTLWYGWRRQSVAGVLFYPLAVLFLVELLRLNYFSSTRCFPVVLALLFVWAVAKPAPPPQGVPAPW
jgi:hypothetical protein